jgi:hypothetical protein
VVVRLVHTSARLVVSHSTCPPLSSSPHVHSFVLGTAVINNNNRPLPAPATRRASASAEAQTLRPLPRGLCPSAAQRVPRLLPLPALCRERCACGSRLRRSRRKQWRRPLLRARDGGAAHLPPLIHMEEALRYSDKLSRQGAMGKVL